jgi:CspA family cold shock protein
MATMTGKVIRIVLDKGFGFIRATDGAAEYFFHKSELRGVTFADLREGALVRFEVEPSDRGPRARDVRIG